MIATIAFGAVHPGVRVGVAALALGVALGETWRWRHPRGAARGLWFGAGSVLAVSVAALVPVGSGLRRWLQPGLASRVDASLAVVGESVHPLAVHVGSAWAGWGFAAACLALAMAAGVVARRDDGRGALVGWLAAGCVTVLWAAVQRGLGWTTLAPATAIGDGEAFFGPFVYANHAATLLAAVAAMALGVSAGQRDGRGLPAVIAAVVMGAAAVATGSQSAVVLLAGGAFVVLVLSRDRRARGVGAALGGALVLATGVATWWLPDVADSLSGRWVIWRDALAVVRAAPWLGVGVGGFGDAGWALRLDSGFGTARHAHQEGLQALAELGVVPAIALAAVFVGALLAGVRRAVAVRDERWRRNLVGALAALSVVALESMWDFPLRSGAVALLTATAFGTVLGLSEARPVGHRARPWGVWGLVIAGALATTVGAGLRHEAERSALDVAVSQRPLADRALVALARERSANGDDAGVAAALRAAQIVAPQALSAWLVSARLAATSGDHARAMHAYRTFLSLDLPYGSEGMYVREALRSAPDPVVAFDEVMPDRTDRRCTGAQVLASLGRRDAAEAIWRRHAPEDSRCAVAFAAYLTQRGRADEALSWWDAMAPGCGRARVTGLAMVATGAYAEALPLLDEALRTCDRKDARLRTAIGVARLGVGDDAGLPVLEAIVREDPTLVVARRALVEAYVARSRWVQVIPMLERGFLEDTLTPAELILYGELLRRRGG